MSTRESLDALASSYATDEDRFQLLIHLTRDIAAEQEKMMPDYRDEWTDFEKDLSALLNRHSLENASNTPDFILAMYLIGCLNAWNAGVRQRETWYGRDARPSMPKESHDEHNHG